MSKQGFQGRKRDSDDYKEEPSDRFEKDDSSMIKYDQIASNSLKKPEEYTIMKESFNVLNTYHGDANNNSIHVSNTFKNCNFTRQSTNVIKDESSIIIEKTVTKEVFRNDKIIIKQICKYLSFEDKKSCTLVCKRFNDIICNMNCFCLVLKRNSMVQIIPEVYRNYKKLVIQGYRFNCLIPALHKMLKHLSQSVTHLTLDDCEFDIIPLTEFVHELPLLKSLKLNVFITKDSFCILSENDLPKLLQLKDLNIKSNGKLNEILDITRSASNIQSFTLFDAIFNENLIKFLTKYKNSLTFLSLTKCIVDTSFMSNLQFLHFGSSVKISSANFKTFDFLNELRTLELIKVNDKLLNILKSTWVTQLTECKIIFNFEQDQDVLNFLQKFEISNHFHGITEKRDIFRSKIDRFYSKCHSNKMSKKEATTSSSIKDTVFSLFKSKSNGNKKDDLFNTMMTYFGFSMNNSTRVYNNCTFPRNSIRKRKKKKSSIIVQKTKEVFPYDKDIMKLIWKYLSFEDKTDCTLVCNRFNDIISNMDSFRLVLQFDSMVQIIPEVSRHYKKLVIQGYHCNCLSPAMHKMLKNLSQSVTDLTLDCCEFDIIALSEFLGELPLLESLTLEIIITIDSSWISEEDFPNLLQLKNFNINVNKDKLNEILNITESASNIQSLALFDTTIDENLVEYLTKYKNSLTSLSIANCLVEKSFMSNLNSLHIDSTAKLSSGHLYIFDGFDKLNKLNLIKINDQLLKIWKIKRAVFTDCKIVYNLKQDDNFCKYFEDFKYYSDFFEKMGKYYRTVMKELAVLPMDRDDYQYRNFGTDLLTGKKKIEYILPTRSDGDTMLHFKVSPTIQYEKYKFHEGNFSFSILLRGYMDECFFVIKCNKERCYYSKSRYFINDEDLKWSDCDEQGPKSMTFYRK